MAQWSRERKDKITVQVNVFMFLTRNCNLRLKIQQFFNIKIIIRYYLFFSGKLYIRDDKNYHIGVVHVERMRG